MKQLTFLFVLFFLFSCNKENRFSKRLMKREIWKVQEVSIDGVNTQMYGSFKVATNVDIYDSVPSAIWNWNNEDAVFDWQFQDKGKSFQLNYIQQCLECDASELDSLDYLSFGISGKYAVEKHGLNKMCFSSLVTKNFTGKEVLIKIKKQ